MPGGTPDLLQDSPQIPHVHASDLKIPKDYRHAISSEVSSLWEDSMAKEYFGLFDAGTFGEV